MSKCVQNVLLIVSENQIAQHSHQEEWYNQEDTKEMVDQTIPVAHHPLTWAQVSRGGEWIKMVIQLKWKVNKC